MSVVAYCPYLAFKSSLRMMLQENRVAMDILVGLLLWTLLVVNLLWFLEWMQARAAKKEELAQEELAQEDCEMSDEESEMDDEEESELLEENEALKSELRELRQENDVLKAGVKSLKKVPLKIIGMKIVGGFRRESVTNTSASSKSLEDQVLQALADGWVISGGPQKSQDSGVWFQNLLRYESPPVPEPTPVPAPVPEPPSEFSCMLSTEEVAEKIRGLPKGVWQTSYDIQKALAPPLPHKTPFAPIKTINSVLYTMLNKGEVEKGKHQDFVRPIWKLL